MANDLKLWGRGPLVNVRLVHHQLVKDVLALLFHLTGACADGGGIVSGWVSVPITPPPLPDITPDHWLTVTSSRRFFM